MQSVEYNASTTHAGVRSASEVFYIKSKFYSRGNKIFTSSRKFMLLLSASIFVFLALLKNLKILAVCIHLVPEEQLGFMPDFSTNHQDPGNKQT